MSTPNKPVKPHTWQIIFSGVTSNDIYTCEVCGLRVYVNTNVSVHAKVKSRGQSDCDEYLASRVHLE